MLTYSKQGTAPVSFAYLANRSVFVVVCGTQRVECTAWQARSMGAQLEARGYVLGALREEALLTSLLPSDPTDLVIALANRGY